MPASSPVPEPRPTAVARLRDRLAVVLFLLLFLIPMLLRSTVFQGPLPYSPALLTKLHNIACLFTHKPTRWNSYYVQLQRSDNLTWVTADQRELFPLEPFGRRTRMHRLLAAWNAKPSRRTEDMARWILVRWVELHPEQPAPIAIRFTQAWMIPSESEPPMHGWEHPEWADAPPTRRRIIATYTVDELFPEDR